MVSILNQTESAKRQRVWLEACLPSGMVPATYATVGSKENCIDPRIKFILRIIGERTIDVDPVLASTTRSIGLSAPRLRRIFKREVGMALREYVRKTRMNRAAALFESQTLSIKQVACQSGYADISNFYRDFRKVHGLTPGQLRTQRLALLCESAGSVDDLTVS